MSEAAATSEAPPCMCLHPRSYHDEIGHPSAGLAAGLGGPVIKTLRCCWAGCDCQSYRPDEVNEWREWAVTPPPDDGLSIETGYWDMRGRVVEVCHFSYALDGRGWIETETGRTRDHNPEVWRPLVEVIP